MKNRSGFGVGAEIWIRSDRVPEVGESALDSGRTPTPIFPTYAHEFSSRRYSRIFCCSRLSQPAKTDTSRICGVKFTATTVAQGTCTVSDWPDGVLAPYGVSNEWHRWMLGLSRAAYPRWTLLGPAGTAGSHRVH